MAFEYCAGTLDDMVNGKCEGPTDPLQQITSGLAFLHSSNIVHYNLKPSNILVSFPTGNTLSRMKLADFGLVHKIKQFNRAYNAHQIAVCPPDWRPPEYKVTPAFDVYCLGRIFCFILSNGLFPTKIHFAEFIKFITNTKKWNPLSFPWSVEALRELIISMLKYQPLKRPTASQVLQHPVFATLPSPEAHQGKKKTSYFFKTLLFVFI